MTCIKILLRPHSHHVYSLLGKVILTYTVAGPRVSHKGLLGKHTLLWIMFALFANIDVLGTGHKSVLNGRESVNG